MFAELIRYGLVGSLTAIVFAGLIWVLSTVLGGGILATILSYGVAIGVQYIGHSVFTFKRDPADAPQALKFTLTHLLGVSISIAIINVLAPTFGLSPHHAAALVVCVLASLNFFLFRFWAFTKSPPGAQP